MHFSRKTILVVGAALLAACGDKVSVTEYTPAPTPAAVLKVNSVAVAPLSATLNIGQSITLTAAVNADAGVATTVSWLPSDAAKVSVSASGVVLALAATPGVAVCATSTVDSGKKGCATIVVTPATALIPATVSINSITSTVGGLNAPVTVSNVTGQIDVTLNVNPGNQTISKIVLLVGTVRQDSQMYSAAQAAALRFSADQAVAAQSTFPQVVFSVSTAAYDAVTGVAKFPNGTKAISAQLYTVGTTTAAATATAAQSLTFANVDVLAAKVTPTVAFTSANTATSVTGYLWSKISDSLDVTILPVLYSGRAITSIAMRPVCGDSVWTKVVSPFKVRYGVPTAGYSTANGGNCSATATTDGEQPIFVSAIMADGNSAPALAFDASIVAQRRRYDNLGPTAPTIGRQDVGISGTYSRRAAGWFNDAVNLTGVVGSTESVTAPFAGNLITARGVDAAVSSGVATTDPQVVTYKAFVGTSLATALASSPVTNVSSLAETAGFSSCVVVRAYDALGNVSAAPTDCSFTGTGSTVVIGVDRTIPDAARYTIDDDAVSVLAALKVEGADSLFATGGKFFILATDAAAGAATGKSGIKGVRMAITQVANGVSTCWYGRAVPCTNGTGTDGFITNNVTQANYYETAVVGANGYYTVTPTVYDNAGNTVALAARTFLVDATVPGAPVGTPAITGDLGRAAVMGVTVVDDQDMGYYYGKMLYGVVSEKCSVTTVHSTFTGAPTPVVVNAATYSGCTPTHGRIIPGDAAFSGGMSAAALAAAAATIIPTAGIQLTSVDYAGNVTVAAATAASVNAFVPVTTFGGVIGTANRCGAIGSAAINSGYCTFVTTAPGVTAYTGAGVNAPTMVTLKATVVVKDSIALPVTCGLVNAAPVAACDAAIAAVNKLTVTPFSTVNFYVPDGQADVKVGNGSNTATVSVDSSTIAGYYLSTTTNVYTYTFAPATTFGILTPIKGRVVPPGAVNYFAVGRYSTSSTATNKGIVATLAAAGDYSIIADGSTKVSVNSVKSTVSAITVTK